MGLLRGVRPSGTFWRGGGSLFTRPAYFYPGNERKDGSEVFSSFYLELCNEIEKGSELDSTVKTLKTKAAQKISEYQISRLPPGVSMEAAQGAGEDFKALCINAEKALPAPDLRSISRRAARLSEPDLETFQQQVSAHLQFWSSIVARASDLSQRLHPDTPEAVRCRKELRSELFNRNWQFMLDNAQKLNADWERFRASVVPVVTAVPSEGSTAPDASTILSREGKAAEKERHSTGKPQQQGTDFLNSGRWSALDKLKT